MFNERFRYTQAASDLDLEVTVILQPIFDRCRAAGFSPRDISHVMQQAVQMLEVNSVLDVA